MGTGQCFQKNRVTAEGCPQLSSPVLILAVSVPRVSGHGIRLERLTLEGLEGIWVARIVPKKIH